MSRVSLEFAGNSRGAVTAAGDTVRAIEKVKRTANEQASSNIAKRVEERRSLEQLAAEYTRVATTAKRGSEQQVAAYKLEQRALRELNDQHAVHSRRLSSSTRELERFSKGAVIGSGALGHLGRTAAIASGSFLGGLGVIEVFREATSEASSLATQLERTTKTFGDQAAGIKRWSKDSVDALGVARAEALGFANDLGQLLTNMKLLPAQAAEISKGLVQRAADVSAQRNVPIGDVVGAFSAALNGQTRGLREYGISLDNVRVKQEAEREGLVRSTVDLGKVRDATEKVRIAKYELGVQEQKHGIQSAEAARATVAVHTAETALAKAEKGHAETLTAAQRAQATYNAILDQTAKQRGYIASHTNDLTVQERKLHAEEKQLFEILGGAIVPQLVKYLPLLTTWIDRNEKNGTFQRDLNKAIDAGTPIVQGVVAAVKTAVGVFKDFAGAVGGSKNAVELLGGVFVGYKMTKGLVAVIDHVKALRLALLALGEAPVMGAIGAVATALAVLVSSGDAPNGSGFPATTGKSKKAVVSRLLQDNQFTQAQLIQAAIDAGIDPSTPAGRAMKNPKFVSALYKQASAAGLVGNGTGATSPQAKGLQLVATAQTALGVPYHFGGAPSLTKPTDCSGLMVAVFRDNGISIPRTSQEQYAQAPIKDQRPLLPGDLVFSDGVHPGHVGMYIGGGMVLEDPHTGDHVKTIKLSSFGWNGESARWWAGANKNTSGHSNDPASDAGGGNRTPTPTTPTPDTTSTDTSTTTTPFVEKPKPPKKPKKVADPIATYRTQVKTAIAQINDDVDKGLFPKGVGDRLAARAEQIQQSLQHATKADIPKIRTQMRDLNEAVQSALRASRDQTLLGRDIGQIRTDVKTGLLSKSVGDSLIAQAKAINQRLVKDIFDPKKSAADEAAAKGFRARIAAMLSQAAEVRTIDADTAKARLDVQQQLDQALGVPVEHASQGAVAKAKAGIAKIRAEFAANKIIPAAEKTKLKQQLAGYEATVADGMQGVIDTVNENRTKFETSWSKLASAALSGFDKETSKHLSQMQKDAAAAIQQLQVTVQGSGFAAFLFGGGVGQTPTEQLLAARAAAKQAADDTQSIADAQKQLADAQAALQAGLANPTTTTTTGGTAGVSGHDAVTLPNGDTVTGIGVAGSDSTSTTNAVDLAQLQQAVVDAQKQLDDAIYQQETDDLDSKAQLERDAADKALAAAQTAAQDQADQDQQTYQDQRDTQRQHIQDMFDDEVTAIEQGKKTLGQAMGELGTLLGFNLASSFATWFDPSNPDSVTATLASFLYQVNLAKGQLSTQAALSALGSLPASTSNWADLLVQGNVDFRTGFDANGIPIRGFASGGWASQGRPVVDRRDTIPALLRRGEYVMSPEEVAAGGPSWGRSGRGVGDVYLDGKKVGVHIAAHVTDAQDRQIGYSSLRS